MTFASVLIGYSYFAVTKRDYTFPDMRNSWLIREMRRQYQKKNFPTDRFFHLQYEITRIDPEAIEDLNEQIDEEAKLQFIKKYKHKI